MTIPITESEGRVASEPIYARYTVPDSPTAEMDGIAVKSSETVGAGEQRPISLSNFVRVDTGNIVPAAFDAVIMIEDVRLDGSSCIIRKPARPGQHIRPPGQDVRNGDLIIPQGHQIRSSDISALASYGYDEVAVKVVRVGIIPVGNELVPIGTIPQPGQVIETNSLFASSFLSAGSDLYTYDLIRDDPLIEETVKRPFPNRTLCSYRQGPLRAGAVIPPGLSSKLGLLFHGVAMLPETCDIQGDRGPVVGCRDILSTDGPP